MNDEDREGLFHPRFGELTVVRRGRTRKDCGGERYALGPVPVGDVAAWVWTGP